MDFEYIYGTIDMRLGFGGERPTSVGYSNLNMARNINSRNSTLGYVIKFSKGVVACQSRL